MSIYIEPLIIRNLLIAYCISASSYRFLRVKTDLFRIIIAICVGVAASVFYPLTSLSLPWILLIKTAVAATMCLILFAGKCKLVKAAAVFVLCVLTFGGCAYFAACIKYKDPKTALAKPCSIWLCLVLAASVAVYSLVKRLSVVYHKATDSCPYQCEYKVKLLGKEISGNGYIDTGNLLYDDKTGLPVTVISVKALAPYLSDFQFGKLFAGHADEVFAGARKLKCNGVTGEGEMWIVRPESFEVYFGNLSNIVLDVMVGLSFLPPVNKNDCSAILPPCVVHNQASK